MAEEITESSNDPPPETPPTPPSEPEFDSKTMRRTKPGLKRLFLTFTVLVSFLLGFPFLFKSVEIYRSPLPFHDIDSLSNDVVSNPFLFPCHFQAILVPSDPKSSSIDLNLDELELSIRSKITKLASKGIASQCGACTNNFTLSLTLDDGGCTQSSSKFYKCGAIRAVDLDFGDDESVDEALESAGLDSGGKVYSVVVVVNGDGVEGVKVVVGKYRHAWIVGRDWGVEEVAERLAEIFVRVFVNGGREEGLIHGEFMPVGADGRIVLSFNLLNADPSDWTYDWDFRKIDETLLAPMIDALGPIANISVESQVLYHTPKFSVSSWDEKLGGYIFSTKDLPFFVNSNEWHLDTSIAAGGRSKILQFVVYVPSAKECPLLLQLPNGEISKTNAFISPMWGGVMVWNPQSCSRDSDSELLVRHIMSPEDLQKVFEVFVGQFRQLFGLKSGSLHVGAMGTYSLLASEKGFTEWELDVLSRQHTCFNIHSSATTLGSLSKLVQSLPRMIIMDEIGKQVKFSLEAAKLARVNASLGFYDASAVSSRQARSLAEDAFFHPSIMSVSYYSFEHCFAVYSPFFLPVSMLVLPAALREWRRYKQEKAKYLLWKAKEKVAS
uniref:GPI transamidase component PIG-S n=1 Tax=Populus trichocarpa TaxID=3694 RepID=A0A2K2BNY0_POPTR|eukprot:XP_024451085.1 GPI transamidase component PIG-S-like [Populus trichocarpa]